MAQAALSCVDTLIARKWREKERQWRQQSTDWRSQEMEFRSEEILVREEEREFLKARMRWREEDMKQMKVNNSRYLWNRYSERNRRAVEEKSEQLRSLSWLTGLITSFIMTNPIEFNYPLQTVNVAHTMAYAIFAAIVPTLLMTSTIISVYFLGRVLKMGKMFVAEDVEESFIKQCRHFAENNETQAPPNPRRTFERFWNIGCKNKWDKAFLLYCWGIVYFLALLCSMSFIKFFFANGVAILYSSIIGIVCIVWVGTQLTWGEYLRKAQPRRSISLVNIRTQEASLRESPFRWHVRPESHSFRLTTSTHSVANGN